VVAGLVTPESIVNPDSMFASNNIDLILERATRIDATEKRVELSNGRVVPYDKLILCPGASPFVPPMEGRDLKGVFTLRSLSDGERIKAHLEREKPHKLVFVGSGFISLEVASLLAMARPGTYEITVVELLGHPLPLMIDPELATEVLSYFQAKGVGMLMGRKVERIIGHEGMVSGVELDGGERIDADMVFINVGARPNLELADEVGLDAGIHGIKVNRYLETSDPDILAAGDCVEKEHFVTKQPVPGMLRGPAVIQGRLAAKRLAGFEIEFPGVLNNCACKLFEKTIASTGLTEEQAQREGFDTVSATVKQAWHDTGRQTLDPEARLRREESEAHWRPDHGRCGGSCKGDRHYQRTHLGWEDRRRPYHTDVRWQSRSIIRAKPRTHRGCLGAGSSEAPGIARGINLLQHGKDRERIRKGVLYTNTSGEGSTHSILPGIDSRLSLQGAR
jgi:NADH oxidase (H2O2-forming)